MINPSKLSHKITIYKKSITQDAELNAVEDWLQWRTLWSSPMPKTGKEYYKLNVVNSEITEVFEVRYIKGITPHDRIKFKCKYLEIIDVINKEERNETLIITCKGVV